MMLAAFCFLVARQASPPMVVENAEPGAKEVSIQLIARLPLLTARQSDALDDLVHAIPREVEGYSRHDILIATGGAPVKVLAGPDYVLISFTTAPANWRVGLSIVSALAFDSKLAPSERKSPGSADAWNSALRPIAHDRVSRPGEADALYRIIFRPGNLTLAVGGAITPGQPAADWQARMASWTTTRARPRGKYEDDPPLLKKNPGGLDSIDLAGPAFGPGDAAMPAKVLALYALGSGKGASLFRVARQQLQYSYRQEALLYPVPEGWQCRIVLVMKHGPDLSARADTLRSALLDDVKGWTEADRLRALGMADAVLNRSVDFSPFAFGPHGALPSTLEGRTFLRAYWELKTGKPWDPAALLTSMRGVNLDLLRTTAAEFLTQTKATLLPSE